MNIHVTKASPLVSYLRVRLGVPDKVENDAGRLLGPAALASGRHEGVLLLVTRHLHTTHDKKTRARDTACRGGRWARSVLDKGRKQRTLVGTTNTQPKQYQVENYCGGSQRYHLVLVGGT